MLPPLETVCQLILFRDTLDSHWLLGICLRELTAIDLCNNLIGDYDSDTELAGSD
jgi:hypothetical protein